MKTTNYRQLSGSMIDAILKNKLQFAPIIFKIICYGFYRAPVIIKFIKLIKSGSQVYLSRFYDVVKKNRRINCSSFSIIEFIAILSMVSTGNRHALVHTTYRCSSAKRNQIIR